MNRSLTCILCPRGCRLEVSLEGNAREVSGAGCPRGIAYAEEELRQPVRMVTSTVALSGADLRRLPVKTARPVPKDSVLPVVKALRDVRVCAPVHMGDVVLKNAAGTGTDVVAARSVSGKETPG